MFRVILPFVLGLTALCSAGCMHLRLGYLPKQSPAGEAKDAKALSAEAHELILKGKLDEAIEKARRAIELDPKLAEAHKNLALAYCDSGKPEKGLDSARLAVALAPNLDKAHHVLGKILRKLGRFQDSQLEFREAIRLNPKYDKAYYMLALAYDETSNTADALAALDEAVRLQPTELEYQGLRDSLKMYIDVAHSRKAPALQSIAGKSYDYSRKVLTGVYYELLKHQDYDLLEQAAEQARSSRERLRGGQWKLHFVYQALRKPDDNRNSDHQWNRLLELLQQWVKQKPDSITARVALAGTYIQYGWDARGTGPASTVSAENYRLFAERLGQAKTILKSVPSSEIKCPQWYGEMMTIAMGEGWDRQASDDLFTQAVSFEPGYDDLYSARALYLFPQWYGKPGELRQFLDGLLQTSDGHGAMHYFIVCQTLARLSGSVMLLDLVSAPALNQGLVDLQKTAGASNLDLNWACFMAMGLQDKALTRKLLAQIGDDWAVEVWTNEEFQFAKKWSTS